MEKQTLKIAINYLITGYINTGSLKDKDELTKIFESLNVLEEIVKDYNEELSRIIK